MNKIFMKKLLGTSLAVAMLSSIFSGCAKAPDNTSTAVSETKNKISEKDSTSEPLTITMLYRDEGSYPYQENWLIFNEILKRKNVKLEAVVVPNSDWETKANMLMSMGDAPDFIPRMYASSETQYVNSGSLVAISDHLDKMPNFKKRIEQYNVQKEIEDQLTQLDGKAYLAPSIHEIPWIEVYMAYRTDILDQEGLKIPTTIDELYEVSKKLKEKYPNQYIWSDKWNGNNSTHLTEGAFGARAIGWNYGNGLNYNDEKDEFYFDPISEGYKEWLKFMNKMVKEELYDPETFIKTGDQIVEGLSTGKTFMSISNINETIEWNEFGKESVGEEFNFTQFLPPMGIKGNQGKRSGRLEAGFIIPKTTEESGKLDEVIEFLDWLYYSEEAEELVYWGVEGETFKKNSDGNNVPIDGVTYRWMNPGAEKDMRKDFGVGNLSFMGSTSQKTRYGLMPPEERKLQEAYLKERPVQKPIPNISITEEQQEQYNLLNTNLSDYAKQMYIQFIVQERDIDKEWDSYISELKKKGLDDYMKIVTESYNATKEAKKK